jgi:hypothetical protein
MGGKKDSPQGHKGTKDLLKPFVPLWCNFNSRHREPVVGKTTLDGDPEQRRSFRIVGRLGAGAAVGLAAQLGAVPVVRERARRRARALAQHLDEEMGGGEVGAREIPREALREVVGTGTDDELPDLPVIAFPAAFAIDGIGARLARPRVTEIRWISGTRRNACSPRGPGAARSSPDPSGGRITIEGTLFILRANLMDQSLQYKKNFRFFQYKYGKS